MTTIALTGGIASGKSTISRRLRELGAVILDADVFAREAVAPGSPGLRAVRAHFGERIIADDGSLDRPALAAIVFADERERLALNDIVHPEVRRLTEEARLRALADDPDAVIVHDIPLLVESTSNYDYDEIWVADAPDSVRVERLVALRGMPLEEAERRVASQATDEERRRIADVLIDTTTSLEETIAEVDRLWARVSVGGALDDDVRYGTHGAHDEPVGVGEF